MWWKTNLILELQHSLGWNGALEDILLQQDIELPI